MVARFVGKRGGAAVACVLMSLVLGFVLQQTWEPELDAAYRDAAVTMIAAFVEQR
jgi:hypothetical protein